MIKTSLVLLTLFSALFSQAALHPKRLTPEPILNRKILVAVIDTGADLAHPDLQKSIWTNPLEKNDGLDHDHNSFIDDIHGWNFVDHNSSLSDQHGHGTHIAGIIAKNKNIQLMILKALDVNQSGEAAIEATVKAIHYAIDKQVDIINYSGGGTASHPRERAALELARKKGILIVAAAGNLHSNMDRFGFYPANYRLSNVISVAAVDETDHLIQSSNYGPNSVMVAASGKDIESALPNRKYGKMTGTSQATAVVTRALASVLLTTKDPIQKLIENGKPSQSLAGKIKNAVIIQDF
jgi:major intracellular serine protease